MTRSIVKKERGERQKGEVNIKKGEVNVKKGVIKVRFLEFLILSCELHTQNKYLYLLFF